MRFKGTHLTNKELLLVYNYLNGEITRPQLTRQVTRARTNAYYYIGRAMHYWLKTGVLKFKRIQDTDELGGIDVKAKEQ